MEEKAGGRKKKWKIMLAVLLALCVAGAAGYLIYGYQVDKDTLGRMLTINRLEVSKLTVDEEKQKIQQKFQIREVVFREEGAEVYRTTLQNLGYSLDEAALSEQLNAVKRQRDENRSIIPHKVNFTIGYQTAVDQAKEKTALPASNFANKERTPSVSAAIRYDENAKNFVMVQDVQGTEIDEARLLAFTDETLAKVFPNDLLGGEIAVDLGVQAYKLPETVASDDMQAKLESLNTQLKNYRSTKITYTFGSVTEVLDNGTTEAWLKIGEETVSIDEAAAKSYVETLASNYNTIYVPRTFHTSYGSDITISNNEYGYRIDQDAELKQLLEDLKSGKEISREPVYNIKGLQRNGKDDLVGSYIEVSLDNQHLWLYKDGALITETDIVSGAPTPERETHTGAYLIPYKASPFQLTSETYGYNTKVTYWMPFVYGQGLHDASWQSSFGGNRYRSGAGSHGCVNLPKDQAALIYNTIGAQYPIILY